MAYPFDFDVLIDPDFTVDDLDTPGVELDLMQIAQNDLLRALMAKVGINDSPELTSLDYLSKNRHADYTINYDGTNYSARRERDATVPYTSNTSVHNVANSAFADLGGATDAETVGGKVRFATPDDGSHVMEATDPITPGNQTAVTGPGTALRIKAVGSNWSGGTLAAPKAMLDCYGRARLYVGGLHLDCNLISGTTGILYNKLAAGGAIGGNDANSYFEDCLVRHWGVSGFQIGKSGDVGNTAAIYLQNMQVLDDKPADNGMALAVYIGDVHIGDLCNFRVSNASGYCAYIDAATVLMEGSSHYINNHATNTNGCVHFASGGDCQLVGAYLDNLNSGPAVRASASQGAVARLLVAACRVNGNPLTTDLGTAAFVMDATTNGVAGSVILGNRGTGNTSALRFKSIVENIAGATDPAASQVFLGNFFRYAGAFYTGNRPAAAGYNIVEQPSGTYKVMRQPLFTKAGAISDSDFFQPVDGQQGYDTTNHKFYVRDGGAWKSVTLT
jgi:hypothetical protein